MTAPEDEEGGRRADGVVDARVLGQLLHATPVLEVLPTAERIAEFLSAVLADVPGVKSCAVQLGEAAAPDDGPGSPSSPGAALASGSARLVVPVETGGDVYGAFVLEMDDEPALALYLPFIANLAGSVALLSENRLRREQAERALAGLRRSEQNYRQLFANMPDGYAYCRMLYDEEGRPDDFVYLSVNPAFARLTGLVDVVGKRVTEVIPTIRSESPELLETYGHVARTGEPAELEIDFTPLDLWLHISVFRPEPDHFVAVFSDAGASRRAELALRESEVRFRGYFEQSLVGVAVTSPEKGWLDVNEATCDLLGYSRKELSGLSWADLTHPDDLAADVVQFERVLAGEIEGYRLEKRFLHKDGALVDIDMSTRCRRRPDGSVDYFLALLSDVTERRRAEAEIRRLNEGLERRVAERTRDLSLANAELEEFVYSIAHDLRTPLRAIAGFSEIVTADYHDVVDQTGRDHLQRIRAAATHMGEVMDALLALSLVNRAELNVRDVDLSELARAVAGQLREQDPGRAVELAVEDGLVARADASLCAVLLRNLLGNAWKFTAARSPAHISFDAASNDGRRVYRVSDDGAGFDQRYAGRLFRPFERLHLSEEFPGTGIGLAVVRRIVHRFGGDCWAEGEVGKGATVFFTLPEPTGSA